MLLKRLIKEIKPIKIKGNLDIDIKGLTYDSRNTKRQDLFFAIKGLKRNGLDYVKEAINKGAAAIITEKEIDFACPYIQVKNVKMAMAKIASAFFGDPTSKLTLLGITGTNGKSTVAFILENILKAAGKIPGTIGTLGYKYPKEIETATLTTPESLDIQRISSKMLSQSVTHLIIEVSSHAVKLHRIHECKFDIGIFTNLGRDHLDFHGSLKDYRETKKKFFNFYLQLNPTAKAVLNIDDPTGRELSSELDIECIRYSLTSSEADIFPLKFNMSPTGLQIQVKTKKANFKVNSHLIGTHNLLNILAAIGAAESLGLSPESISEGIFKVKKIPGRLEHIYDPRGVSIFVDYAHTPDALERVLKELRSLTKKRLIVVAGCGGNRDKGKRPMMGKVMGSLSDFAFITSDNPRFEDPKEIIKDILRGIIHSGARDYIIQPDRRKAIYSAIKEALPGDIVLIAGKGHETFQLQREKKIYFDDRKEAKAAIKEVT
jgi:UDP-N-acetylmuramyl-tripeptide synthetase